MGSSFDTMILQLRWDGNYLSEITETLWYQLNHKPAPQPVLALEQSHPPRKLVRSHLGGNIITEAENLRLR
jgi:hypothetical protein